MRLDEQGGISDNGDDVVREDEEEAVPLQYNLLAHSAKTVF